MTTNILREAVVSITRGDDSCYLDKTKLPFFCQDEAALGGSGLTLSVAAIAAGPLIAEQSVSAAIHRSKSTPP
jgi:hypothetical protein